MKKLKNSAAREAEEAASILEEYKQRFAHAIDREKERVREIAEQESLSIIIKAKEESEQIIAAAKERAARAAEEEVAGVITSAEQDAQQIADKRIIEAQEEAAEIVSQSRELASQILHQVERLIEACTQLQERVDSHTGKLTERLERELDTFAEAKLETERNIVDARKIAQKEFEASVGLITEAKESLEQAIEASQQGIREEVEHENEPLASIPATAQASEGVVESAATLGLDSDSRETTADRLYMGTLELNIAPRANSAQMERLQKCLWKVPGVQVLSAPEPAGERTSVTIFSAKPLPLLNILKKMTMVKDAIQNNNDIHILMETGFG